LSTVASEKTELKRDITRWNRRLGWALIVFFPLSYATAWWSEQTVDGTVLNSWVSFFNVLIQVIATLVLLTHAGYSFYVFGFPAPRWNLRAINGYAAYFLLLTYLMSQAATDIEPQHTVLVWISFTLIGIHVLIAGYLAYKRPRRETLLKEDIRALISPDAQTLEEIAQSRAAGTAPIDVPVLEAKSLNVDLGSVRVLFDVDLRVMPGEIVALMGNNGAGKTTTLRTLAGLTPATGGAVLLDGFGVTSLTPAGRAELGLSLIIGGRAVFGPLSVRENLEMFAYRLGLSSAELESRIEKTKEIFPWIADRSAQNAATLSGGEQQMLAIAQALVVRPKILLIDEFSLGLSPKIVGELIDVVRTISENGTAVLLVEQSASVACEVADRVYALERGSIVLAEDSTILAAEPERLTNLYLQGSANQGSSV